MKIVLSLLALTLTAAAQKPVVAPPTTPQLTYIEKVAVQAVVDKDHQVAKDKQNVDSEQQEFFSMLRQIEADIAKTHPGYHLDEKTLTLAKDAVPTPKK